MEASVPTMARMSEDLVAARLGSRLFFRRVRWVFMLGLPCCEVGAVVASLVVARPCVGHVATMPCVGRFGIEDLHRRESCPSHFWSSSSESELSVIYVKGRLFGIDRRGLREAIAVMAS